MSKKINFHFHSRVSTPLSFHGFSKCRVSETFCLIGGDKINRRINSAVNRASSISFVLEFDDFAIARGEHLLNWRFAAYGNKFYLIDIIAFHFQPLEVIMINRLIFISLFLALSSLACDALSQEHNLTQPLNHFDSQNRETWTMVGLIISDYDFLMKTFFFSVISATTRIIKRAGRSSSMSAATWRSERGGWSMDTCTTSHAT